MAKIKKGYGNNKSANHSYKKTRQGHGRFSKFGHKGGGPGGSTPSGSYRKKSRGQGSSHSHRG